EQGAVDAWRVLVKGADGRLDLAAAAEPELLLVVDHGQRRLEVAQGPGDVGGAAGAAGQRMAERVVALRQRPAEPAVDLAPGRVARLPDPDRLEVREGRFRVADALDHGHPALVPELLQAF